MPVDVATLTRLIDNEIIKAAGLRVDGWVGRHLHGVLGRATHRFSELFAQVDCIVAEQGVPAGASWLLSQLAGGLKARGAENVPPEGPLVIASNHPGTVDSLALLAAAQRKDIKILASKVPFLQTLPHISQHLIFTPARSPQGRAVAVRESIRHLERGGALLLFARAGIDPDPAFMPEAARELSRWTHSLEIFLHSVPCTQVIVSIVSGVLAPEYMQNPITRLRRSRPDRQRLAMMLQIIQQMLGKKLDIVPRLSFSEVVKFGPTGEPDQVPAILRHTAETLMDSHLAWQI